MRLHYVAPMAGRGSRFSKNGYVCPKPSLEIYGKPFFYWSTRSIQKFMALASLDFAILQEHIDKFGLDKRIKSFFPDANICALNEVTSGAAVTCMKCVEFIDDDLPIVFNDCDHLFKSQEFNEFCNKSLNDGIDGLLLTFPSREPKYSFVEKDKDGNVTRAVEKEAVSDEAICGCYYFKNKMIFMDAANRYLTECNYSEYFMSGVYNILIKDGRCVKSMRTDFHVPFGVPEEYETAKKDCRYLELR